MKSLVIRGASVENTTGEGKTLLDKQKSLTNRVYEKAKLRDNPLR